MGSCFSACKVERRRRSGQPKAARGDQDLLCGVGTQDAGGLSAGLGGQSASVCILDAETAQVMMHMTSAAASDCCHGHVFTSSASSAVMGCPPACLAGTGSNSREHITLNSEALGLLPDRAVKMRTHERAANLALAGLILVPLFISVNPNLNVILTACLTVYVGCYRSVKATPPPKTMSKEHAMRYPLVRSVMLLSLFLLLKFVSKDLVNTFLRSCFFVPDIEALYATLLPLVDCFLPQGWDDNAIIWRAPYFHPLSVEFTKSQAVASISGFFICVWSAMKKHWLANNVLGIAYCIQRIEMLSLGSFKTGGIFLAGHFVYDVFWVFFTPVMTTVAKSVDASIKLRFPTADDARTFFILGLGDIVIPGKFVALALHFDVSRGIKNRYFSSAFLGYAAGITATLAVRNWFQAAQPALLYIVPGVTGFVAAHSLWNGEAKPLLEFEEKAGKGDGKDPKRSKKVD